MGMVRSCFHTLPSVFNFSLVPRSSPKEKKTSLRTFLEKNFFKVSFFFLSCWSDFSFPLFWIQLPYMRLNWPSILSLRTRTSKHTPTHNKILHQEDDIIVHILIWVIYVVEFLLSAPAVIWFPKRSNIFKWTLLFLFLFSVFLVWWILWTRIRRWKGMILPSLLWFGIR